MVLLQSEQKLKTGDSAPDFNLLGADGKRYSLAEFKDAKALLIIFMCNHCPYVIQKIGAIRELADKYRDRGLVVVGINANDADNYPEDAYEKMQPFLDDNDLDIYYLHDPEQDVAAAYGSTCTPDPFLFNDRHQLLFHGRIDNAMELGEVATVHTMDNVVAKVLERQELETDFEPSQGCSIKWKGKC